MPAALSMGSGTQMTAVSKAKKKAWPTMAGMSSRLRRMFFTW